jgi:hypothetical protein
VRHQQPLAVGAAIGKRSTTAEQAEARRRTVLVRFVVEQLQAEAEPEIRAARGDRASTASSSPFAARLARASRNAPTPGSTTASARRSADGSLVTSTASPERSSAFATERRLPAP